MIIDHIRACKVCSQKNIQNIEQIDGLCQSCSTIFEGLNRYAMSNIPIEYWNFNMSNFIGPDQLRKIYYSSINNLDSIYNNGTSFCLLGQNGIGKTTVVSCFLKKATHKNYNCLYTTLVEMVSSLIDNTGYYDKFLIRKELIAVDFLVVDEFDNRFFNTENSADLFGKTLESIIRIRLGNKSPTIFCSNSPNIIESFNGALKQSIESIFANVKMFSAYGEDLRKIKKD